MFKKKDKNNAKKSTIRTKALFDMLVGLNVEQAGTRDINKSFIKFQTLAVEEEENGTKKLVEVK